MATLVRSVMLGMKHAAPYMKQQGSGSIINNGSIAERLAGFSSSMVYGAAKAAVIHLTKCTAMELGESGVRVNSISPGAMATCINRKALGLATDAAEQTSAVKREVSKTVQPIQRAGLPDDISCMPRCSLAATSLHSSTATISWSMARSPAAATGPSSSRAMWRCARHSVRRGDVWSISEATHHFFSRHVGWVTPAANPPYSSIYPGLTITFSPSFGFGIGHICHCGR
jgi:hypothetical protein